MDKKEVIVAIIGAGASGTILASQLIEKSSRISNRKLRIYLIERSGNFGPGLAYSTPLESHILNMRASTMSAKKGQPDHFSQWMRSEEARLVKKYPWFSPSMAEYPPRIIYGQYLVALFQSTLEKAGRNNVEFEPVTGQAVDFVKKDGGLDLVLADGSTLAAHVMVLAPGNFPPALFQEFRGVGGYFHYPWPTSRIMENVPPDQPVAILGSGLSAIDTLFALLENNHSERVLFLSRRGLLPKVQGKPSVHRLEFMQQDHIDNLISEGGSMPLSLDQVVQLLRSEIEAAERESINWLSIFNPTGSVDQILEADIEKAEKGPLTYQAVLSATEAVIGQLWNALSIEDQRRFDRDFKSFWTVYRHPMPVSNARKILEALKSGQLHILSGCLCIRSCGESPGFEIDIETRLGVPFTIKAPYIINATGQGHDVACYEDALIQTLLSKGIIQPHPSGGIQADFHTSQVYDQKGNLQSHIYALGEITRGVHFYTNGVAPNRHAADRITDHIIREEDLRGP
jgi:uncharacterized NAD(P)/FAD-binding protein YdhS